MFERLSLIKIDPRQVLDAGCGEGDDLLLAQARRAGVPAPEAPTNPASYLDQNPLLAPLLHEGAVYLASVGHYTIGWRTFPDWSVKLDRLDHGALTPVGTAFVAMRRGALRAATVE